MRVYISSRANQQRHMILPMPSAGREYLRRARIMWVRLLLLGGAAHICTGRMWSCRRALGAPKVRILERIEGPLMARACLPPCRGERALPACGRHRARDPIGGDRRRGSEGYRDERQGGEGADANTVRVAGNSQVVSPASADDPSVAWFVGASALPSAGLVPALLSLRKSYDLPTV